MTDERDPQRHTGTPPVPQTQRPATERAPLTITVAEPEVRRPPTREIPPRPTDVRTHHTVPRWYWVLLGLAVVMLVIDYELVWADTVRHFLEHRVLPARFVRIEHSVQRHVLGEWLYKALDGLTHIPHQT